MRIVLLKRYITYAESATCREGMGAPLGKY
jgi:hypothetical protein